MHQTIRTTGDKRLTRYAGAVVTFLILAAPAVPAQSNGSRNRSAIEPKAVDALRQMGGYLRTLKQFGVEGEGVRDELSADGQKIQLAGTVSYLVRVPNGLRIQLRSDRKQREFIYDGKTLTVYAPRMKHYATVAAPPTIRAMLQQAHDRHGLEFPLADLFTWGTADDGVNDLTAARYVGPANIGGTDTDHYAFRQADADWQVWIQRGSNPLPRKLVITTTTEPTQPQYAVTLNWNLAPHVNSSSFAFVPPRDATKIPLASTVDIASTKRPR